MSALGIKGIEPLLRGADLDGAVVLCEAGRGPEREALTWQFVREGLARGEKVLIILTIITADEAKAGLGRFGVSLDDEVGNGRAAIIAWKDVAQPDPVQGAPRLLALVATKLAELDPSGKNRVLIVDARPLLAVLPPSQHASFFADLVGKIRSGATIGLAFLDTTDLAESAMSAIHEPFDGVLRISPDRLGEGLMMGVVAFEGVEKTGIYLPLRKEGEDVIAGLAAMGAQEAKSCPECGFQILPGFDVCPRCKADLKKLAAGADIFDYLEKLRREVGIKEPVDKALKEDDKRREKLEEFLRSMGVLEERDREKAKERLKALARSRQLPKRPSRPPGLTNGLVRGAGRVNGLGRAGIVGKVNGTGKTNGLVNGLQKARRGMTNGLTNGNGFTNGLGAKQFQKRTRFSKWKLLIVPLAAAALVLVPIMTPEAMFKPSLLLSADGSFSEWFSAASLDRNASLDSSIDLVRAGISSEDGRLGLYFEVAGTILVGNPSTGLADLFQAFLDSDFDSSTGYSVKGIGADYVVNIFGHNHAMLSAEFYHWTDRSSGDNDDWSNWVRVRSASVAVGSGQEAGKMEVAIDLLERPPNDPATLAGGRTLFHSQSWSGYEDYSDFALSGSQPSLEVVQTSVAPETVPTGASTFLELRVRAVGGPVSLSGIDFKPFATLVAGEVTAFRARDQASQVLGVQTYSSGPGHITFTAPLAVENDWQRITIEADVASASGRTLGLRLTSADSVIASTEAVSLFEGFSARGRAYLGSVPSGVVVDGAFSDWRGAQADPLGEQTTKGNTAVDIRGYDAYKSGSRIAFYVRAQGDILRGVTAPLRIPSALQAPPIPDSDHDSVPDTVESQINSVLPYDFNNDNVSDATTPYDIDGDGIEDYPSGSDVWLNITIPTWYPQPWAGRFVSLYKGPERIPAPNRGEDVLRAFLDTDDVPGSGFAVGGMFADYLVEITGRNGIAFGKQYSKFSGSTPWTWSWTKEGSPSAVVEARELEAEVILPVVPPAANVTAVFDLSDWRGGLDGTQRTRSKSLTRSAEGGVSVQQAIYSVDFPASMTSGATVVRDEQGYGLSWRLRGVDILAGGGTARHVPVSLSPPDVHGLDVSYDISGMDAHLAYSVGSERLKEEVTLRAPPSFLRGGEERLSLSFELGYIGGIAPRLSGGMEIQEETGEGGSMSIAVSGSIRFFMRDVPAFTLEAPFATDANGGKVDCLYSISQQANLATLGIECPGDWLASASYPVTIDPTVLFNGYRGENFGYSLAIGDFNGDGKGDLLVGAPYNRLGGSGAGRAYVYLGGATMDNVVDLEIPSLQAGSHFGWSVAAGDLNNDGYSDMVIGAPDYDSGDGRAYVNLGASTLNAVLDLAMVSRQTGEKFGFSVTVGNFNGDSYKDVLIGAPLNDSGGADIGSAYIYFGASNADAAVDKILHGTNEGEQFGYSVGAGNFNGDGYEDAAVGAPEYVFLGLADGRVSVFYGGANMNTVEDVSCNNGDNTEKLGTSVSSTDRNNDGYDDLYGGGPRYGGGSSLSGRVEIFDGGANMDGVVDAFLSSPATYSYFGTSLAKGKIASDNIPEVVVGSPKYRQGLVPNERGRFDLFWNGTGASVNRNGDNDYDHFATSMAIGDLNSSTTYGELAVGAVDFDVVDDTNSGKVYIFNGNAPSSFDTTPDLHIVSKDPGSRMGERLGFSVATGDFNNDGKQDVLAGAPFNSNGGSDTGVAFIFFGKPFMPASWYGPDLMLPGQYAGERFGWNVTAGDVNADGYDDAIIGAPYNDEGGTDIGRAYVFYGGATMNTQVDVDIAGQASGEMFGWDVASGNVNGDQSGGRPIDDMVIGAPQNWSGKGRVYIFFGSTSLGSSLSTPDVKLYRGDTETFGSSIAIGNFNQDGYEDILVGAPLNDTASTDIGAAYIYYGCGNWGNCFKDPDTNFYYKAKVASKGGSDDTTDLLADAQNDDATDASPPGAVTQGDGFYTVTKGSTMHFATTDVSGMTFGTVVAARIEAQDSVENNYNPNGTPSVNWRYSGSGWATTTIIPVSGEWGVIRTYNIYSLGVNTKAKVGSVQTWFRNYDAAQAAAVSFDYVWVNITLIGQQPANVTLKGQVNLERFGHAVETGDFDGDSSYIDDAVVGAPFWYSNTNDTGVVYIFSGSTIRSTSNGGSISTPTRQINSPGSSTAKFGWSLASGNVNGDANDDLMVGAPMNNSGNGAVYWYYGPTSTMSLQFTSNGEQSERRGWSLAAADLVTGYNAEAAMGAPWYDTTSADGRVVILTSIPEFSEVLYPMTAVLLLGLFLGRRRLRRLR